MDTALQLVELNQLRQSSQPSQSSQEGAAQDLAAIDAASDESEKDEAREQVRFREAVERLVCEKVNSHFWMSAPGIKQRAATPALLHSAARHGALARGRHWCWFLLYRHQFSRGISTPALAKLYDRDHTTVLYGIRKIDHGLKARPGGVEATLLRAIAAELAPNYGAFFPGRR